VVEESKTYHVRRRTLFSLDHKDVLTQRDIEEQKNFKGSKKTLDISVNLNSHTFTQPSNPNLLPSIDNRSKSVAKESIIKVSKSPNGKLLRFTTRAAHEAYKEQAHIEYKRGNGQHMVYNDEVVKVTNEVAFYQSLIEMQDWKR
jgi:hypothetical protein